jgi:2-hydroxychromene-2-carboxylate isomerase
VNVDFHFDFLSPYAYLAWTQVQPLARRYGATLRPIPTLLAALLAHGNTRGPAEIPAKRAYVFVDTLRSARHLGVPLAPPPAHPFNPLLALRAVAVVDDAAARVRLIDALYAATWGGGSGCDTIERVQAAVDVAGLPASVLVRAQSEGKERLKQHTDDAIAAGVFGVPTMRLGDGPSCFFFGLDSFGALERHLAGQENIVDDDVTRWRDLPAAASRKF